MRGSPCQSNLDLSTYDEIVCLVPVGLIEGNI